MNQINILEVKFDFDGQMNTIYPVLLEDENELVLIDCGYPQFLNLIEGAVSHNGMDMKKLSKIITTHHDFDHMGALAAFKRKYPTIGVWASEEDTLVVENGKLGLALLQYTLDIDEARNSVKKFLSYDIGKIVCYHGGLYTEDIKSALELV